MAEANVIITSAKLTPSIVNTNQSFIISVGIEQRWFGLATAAGQMIKQSDGAVIATKKEKG